MEGEGEDVAITSESGCVAVLDQKFDVNKCTYYDSQKGGLIILLGHCQWCLQYTCILST